MRISKNYASHCLGLDPHSPTHPTSQDEILDKVTSTSFTKAFTVIAFVGNVSDQQSNTHHLASSKKLCRKQTY